MKKIAAHDIKIQREELRGMRQIQITIDYKTFRYGFRVSVDDPIERIDKGIIFGVCYLIEKDNE